MSKVVSAVNARAALFAGATLLAALVSSAEGRAAYPYRDAALPTEQRVADLISRMSIEEKCLQLGKLRGFRSYERASDGTIVPNADVRELLAKTPVGTIYGVLRADWWTKRDWNTGVVPERYVQAFNAFQKIAVEESRWGIPIFFTEEAPHGLMALGEPVYPTGLGLGSTFDEDLLYRIGLQVGSSRKRGVHGVKAPILDLARDPRWSRCEECFGEDPELVSMLGAAMFRGLYESGMQPCLKHYVGGGASEGGHNCSPVHMGPMELFNGPLRPFRRCINAGARHLMCTYHDIDGEPCTGSHWLLTEVLRGHLGFRGFVTSDAGATSAPFWYRLCRTDTESRAISLKAGCDIESGYNTLKESGRELLKGVKEGLLTEADLDRALSRLLAVKFDMGLFEHPYVDESEVSPSKLKENKTKGDALALEAARKSLVLMKNNGTLPLVRKEPTLAVIGPNAGGKIMNQLGDYTAPQLRKDVLTVLDGVEPFAKSVSYAQGCKIRSKSKAGFAEAENLAAQADVTILVLGGSSSPYGAVDLSDEMAGASIVTGRESDDYDKESGEGTDRCTLGYSGVQEDLFRAIRKKAKKLVVVLIQGRALAVSEIVREADAVLLAWYPGSQGGRAIGEALFGLVNPGGKLPVSLAYSSGQLPVCGDGIVSKRRLYIDGPGDAEFPFGYGLSYTTFAFSDLAVDLEKGEVSVCVKNTGTREGDEVVRFYFTAMESQAVRPWRELFDFARVTVLPGETKKVVRKLDVGKFGYYNRLGAFVKPSGAYTVSVDGCEQTCEVTFK